MPSSSLLSVLLVLACAAVYAVIDWLWGRWLRRRHALLSPRRPKAYLVLAREAQERQVRVERLNWAVDEVLGEAVGRVAGLYEPTELTEQSTDHPVDAWGDVLLADAARRNTLHRP